MKNRTVIDWARVESELIRHEKISHYGNSHKEMLLRTAIESSIEKAKRLIRAKTSCVVKKVAVGERAGTMAVEGGITLNAGKTAKALSKSHYLAVFVVTIGPRLENCAVKLMKDGDSLEGYLLDKIGSIAAEEIAQSFEDFLRKDFSKKSLSVSMRYSPGYCGWPTEEQQKLNTILPFSNAGIKLNESCMMVPRKSISAVCGIGSEGVFAKIKAPCTLCGLKGCSYRRA